MRSAAGYTASMRVALAQIGCVVGDVAANVATMVDAVRDAAGQGCDAVWFPELADTGYALSVMRGVAGPWPGLAYSALSSAARQHRLAVGAGLSERVGDVLFNSLVVFNAEGERVGHYRKAHLFAAGAVNEAGCFEAGDSDCAYDRMDHPTLSGMKHGLSICYDLRFPELYRRRADQGAAVLVNVTAWPEARWRHWDVLTRARAVENQAYFLGVGRVGEDEGIALAGRSRVIAPTGEPIAEAGPSEPALVVAELDPSAVTDFRTAVPALAARRRDLFG